MKLSDFSPNIYQEFNNCFNTAVTFSAFGSIACSKIIFIGTAGRFSALNTSTGASKDLKQFLEILPANANQLSKS